MHLAVAPPLFGAVCPLDGGPVDAMPLACAIPRSIAVCSFVGGSVVAMQLAVAVPPFGAVCVLDLVDYPNSHEVTCLRILRLAGDAAGYDERKKENPWIHGVC